MELAFRTRELRSICEDERVATGAFGPAVSESIKHRVADLRAADSIDDLIVGQLILGSNPGPLLTISLADAYNMVCQPNHLTTPVDATGEVDWRRVRRLQVLEIAR